MSESVTVKAKPKTAIGADIGGNEQNKRDELKDVLDGLIQAASGKGEETETALQGVIGGVLQDRIGPDARARIAKAFRMVLAGRTWGDSIDESGASWAMIHAWGRACPAYRDLLSAVCKAGEAALHARRVQAAHRRAIDGVPEPVFQGGQHVGDVVRYSDRLLELLLKGGDPQRYNPQPSGGGGGGAPGPVQIQINVLPGASADKTPTFKVEQANTPDNPA